MMGIRFVEQVYDICHELAAQAADLVGPHDNSELNAFAANLCGLERMDLDELRSHLAGPEASGIATFPVRTHG